MHNGNINDVPTISMTDRPTFNGGFNEFNGLQILVNDTECDDIQLDAFRHNADGSYSVDVTVTITDHFGLDANDVLSYQAMHDGFPSWWILQHKRDYIPFTTKITLHKTINGIHF